VTPTPAGPPPLPRATKTWYAFGQFAEGLKNEAFSLLLLFYYTAVLGLSGALAGQAILIALLFDAVTDPLVGTVSDRFESRWGRRHPFLYAAALPLGLFFYLVFSPPAGLSQVELFAWLTAMTVATRASMTLFHVPHLALGAELSSDYEERTRIVTLQYVFARIGQGLLGLSAFAWFFRATATFPEGRFNPDAYSAIAATFGVLMTVVVALSAWGTHDRIPHLLPPGAEARRRSLLVTLFGDLSESLRNPSFRVLFLGLALTYVAWGITTALALHLGTYFWRASNAELLAYGVAGAVAVFAGLPFWERVAQRSDKKPTFVRGLNIFTFFIVVPALLKLIGWWPARESALYIPAWVATSGFLSNFGLAATMVTGRSMMADVTDEDALSCGRRREGIFFGAVSFSAKAAFGVGSLVAGLIIGWLGLVPNQPPDSVAPRVVQGLGVTLATAILVLCGGSVFLFSRYGLTRERHAQIQRALRLRETTT